MKKDVSNKFFNHLKIMAILSLICVVILSGCVSKGPNNTDTETTTSNESISNESISNESISNESISNESTTSETTPVEIKITYPLNTANIQENIQGTAKNIPEGQTAWLFIYPHTAYKYYPINKLDVRDEKWSCPAQFGEPKDVGTQFDIVVVLADKEAHAELANYLETCIETKNWPGIQELPESVEMYDKVTVTRV